MSLTITIPGAVEATIGATAPAVLTIGVGTPGATGPAGPGVPAGGLTAQFLQKTSGLDYATDWVTLPAYLPLAGGTMNVNAAIDLSDTTAGTVSEVGGYGMAVSSASNSALLSNVLFDRVFVKNATSQTTLKPTGVEFPDATLQTTAGLSPATAASTYQTLAGMSSYLTTSAAASTYAVTARGLPASGTVGQVLTKQSGTAYDSAWATLIPGDRYLTSSTTSLTIDNANKTLTVGTGLSYSSQQDIVISYDAAHHMHARVIDYNSSTGQLDVDVLSHTGSGTFSAWTVNVGGTTPLQSVLWGEILGTLGDQSDLATALNSKLELSGGILDVNATIDASTATASSTFAGDAFGVQLSANPSENSSLQYGGLQVQNAVGTMSVTPAGLTFPNASSQTVAYPGSTGFLLKADNLSGLADTAVSRTNLGLGTMATATAADYSTTTVANGLYYPLSGNPSAFLVAADITGKAPLASPALTGNVTITSNSASPALVITQDGAGDIVQFKDVASDTTYTFIDQNGKVNTIPAVTTGAGFNIPNGVAPTSNLVNGDFWTTTSGVFTRINGNSVQIADSASGITYSGNNTFTGPTLTFGNTTAASTVNIGTGATLTATTKAINIGTNGVSGSTTNITIGSATGTNATQVNGPMTVGQINGPITVSNNFTANGLNINIGTLTATGSYNFGTGALVSGATRAIGIGTNALAGSTNNITIGSAAGTSTTTLQGITNGVTQTAGDSSLKLATTAFVTTADNLKANLASPTFTGTPLSTTAAVDTNTTQIATTAFVVGQAGSATPIVDGTAAVGTSLRYARQDHVHGTDTTRAPLASPTFTGTPTLPTGTIATTQTTGNNTTAVATTAFVTAAVPGFATTAEIASPSSTTKVVAPNDVVRMLVNRATFDTQNSSPTFATSGAGATAYKMTNDRSMQIGTPNVGVDGYGQMIYDTTAASWGILGAKRGDNFFTQDWSKRIWMSGTHMFDSLGDANTTAYCMLGGRNTVTTGNPSNTNLRGIGWKLVGGGTALKLLTYGYDGATITATETTSSFTPVVNQSFDWMIVHAPNPANAATSYCYLYVNDSLVATGIYAPADATINYNYFYHSFESTASMATRLDAIVFPVKVWWSRS